MNRLTAIKESEDGRNQIYYKNKYSLMTPIEMTDVRASVLTNMLYDILNRLKKYEDTGLEPEEIKDIIKAYNKDSTKAAYYEQLEEQGLLKRLPCMVGDKVYRIVGNEIEGVMVGKFILNSIGIIAVFIKKDGRTFNDYTNLFGDIYFLTREEAEKALKESEVK